MGFDFIFARAKSVGAMVAIGRDHCHDDPRKVRNNHNEERKGKMVRPLIWKSCRMM